MSVVYANRYLFISIFCVGAVVGYVFRYLMLVLGRIGISIFDVGVIIIC